MQKKSLPEALTEILVRDDVIAPEVGKQLEILFKDSEKALFTDFLLTDALAERRDILEALSEYYDVPWFDTQGYFFDHALLHQFPKDFLLRNSIIPIEIDEDILVLVASEPDNTDLPALIGQHVSYDVRFEVGIAIDIQNAVKEFYDEPLTEESHEPDDLDWEEEHRLLKDEKRLEENEIEKDRRDE